MYYEEILPELRNLVGKNEKILWYGKPDKKSFIFNTIFSPFFFIAIVFSLPFLTFIINPNQLNGKSFFECFLFFLLYLMPVWIYLYTCLIAFMGYRNTSYIVTDQSIYRSRGVTCQKEYLARIKTIELKKGFINKFRDVGNIKIILDHRKAVYSHVSGLPQSLTRDFSIIGVYGPDGLYQILRNAWNTAKNGYSYANAKQILSEKEKFQREYFDSLNNENAPSIDKEKLQSEYFKNIDNNNSIEDIENKGRYQKENEYSYGARVNYSNFKSLITFMAIIFFIYVIIAVIISLFWGNVQKGSNSIHVSVHKEFGKKTNTIQNPNKKTNQETSTENDLAVAKNLFLNKITQEVKDYQLPEGITLDEKIKKIHPDNYNKLEWEISQPQFDPTYYFVTVSSPADPENFKQALYRFSYNTVSYTVEAMTLETKNMMTNPYQEPIKEEQ